MAKRKAYAKLQCQECKRTTYNPHKSKKMEEKLALKKFCKFCKKHTAHKETKK
jgi:large subunit ribosomal protein L33